MPLPAAPFSVRRLRVWGRFSRQGLLCQRIASTFCRCHSRLQKVWRRVPLSLSVLMPLSLWLAYLCCRLCASLATHSLCASLCPRCSRRFLSSCRRGWCRKRNSVGCRHIRATRGLICLLRSVLRVPTSVRYIQSSSGLWVSLCRHTVSWRCSSSPPRGCCSRHCGRVGW